MGPYPWFQLSTDYAYLGNFLSIVSMYRQVFLSLSLNNASNYSYSVYTVLVVIHNPEMIYSVGEEAQSYIQILCILYTDWDTRNGLEPVPQG